ncbi:MAG: hypothetical protein Q8S53_05865 [Brevundimonas sp.]|uniref:hypothetical protein n=1 Tax=Brevundimonas sp. TaxID=1871086 RepID=UPI0027351829|nr:hypothetical protein [Brevundimonas sp.]MDP3377873.1 hypothetical protein [Brevundimonas sp.]
MNQRRSVQVLNGLGLAGVSVLAAVGTPIWLLLAYVHAKLLTDNWTHAQSAWAAALVLVAAIATAGAWLFWVRRRFSLSWLSVGAGAALFLGLLIAFEYI